MRKYKCVNTQCKQKGVEIIVAAKKIKGVFPNLEIQEGESSYVKHLQWRHDGPLYVTYPENVYCGYCGHAAMLEVSE